MRSYRIFIGMGGVPPHDQAEAYIWERRLHWLMVLIALLAVPAFYLEVATPRGPWQQVGRGLDLFILVAFSLEFLWMLHLTRQRLSYLTTTGLIC